MIFFRSDYSQGAHPKILEALTKTNLENSDGYGLDVHCDNARQMVKDLIGRQDAHVHLMVGGTPTNITTIAASLRPYEAVVAPRSAHIYIHETGGVEATGHRIIAMPPEDGKLTPELIEKAWLEYEDEHTVIPKMVYISNTTEDGTIYKKSELEALSKCCKDHNMYLYMDGARLGAALTCEDNDLSIKDIANLVDAFYIGGTKNGALFGEALVILNDEINNHFRWMIKQNCGLLAKGRLLGVQFEELLRDGEKGIYFQMAAHSNKMSKMLRDGITAAGYSFKGSSHTNQIFPIFPTEMVRELEKDFFFYDWEGWDDNHRVIRLVTSWGTTEEDVKAFLKALNK
jgi:threonine aldolase